MKALVVLNPRGGNLAKFGIDRGMERVAAICKANNLGARIAIALGSGISERIKDELASSRACAGRSFDVVVVGGGDGSVRAAASVLAGSDIPLGVLPLGTLNHFARDLGLPLDLEGAVRLIASGRIGLLDVGEVNGRVFLNNSSLGIYPHLVAERDRRRRHGPRWLAAALALCRVLWRLPRPELRVLGPGWEAVRRTTCLCIANNAYQLDAFASAKRLRIDKGKLCLYMANGQSRMALLQLAIRALLGRLEPDRDFRRVSLESVEISVRRRRRVRVALDGESMVFRPPLHYRIRPRALRVIVPEPASL